MMAAADADVVITSAAVLTSVADTIDDFAAALRSGRSGVRPSCLPAHTRVRAAALLDLPGGATPLDPPRYLPGGATPQDPPRYLPGGATPQDPPRYLPGGATPLDPPRYLPGGATPQDPLRYCAAGRQPSGLLADPQRSRRLRELTSRCALPTQAAARVGWEAALAAGLGPSELARTAVVVGGNNLALDYQARVAARFADGEGTVRPSHALAHLDIDTIGAISELAGAVAEGCTIGGSSASGALALIHGWRLLALHAADHCLVVGALSELSAAEYRAFHDSGAMALDPALPAAAVCRPFDRHRSGFVHGHGAAAVVLERRDTARGRGVRPWAVLAGHAQRLDGKRGAGPRPDRQAETIRAALAAAGLGPGDVDYVNAHATGSRLGDRAEAQALQEVFGAARPLVNSTKELVGHCLAAAGVVEAVATVLQLRDGFCHPNPNLTEPEDTRLEYVGEHAVPARLRAAVSTSFAFSGINAALVITQAEDI